MAVEDLNTFEFAGDVPLNETFACWRPLGQFNRLPETPLTVRGLTSVGNEQIRFLLQDRNGRFIEAPMYKRDFKLCIAEFGSKPVNWGEVIFRFNGKRYELVPAVQELTEEAIKQL